MPGVDSIKLLLAAALVFMSCAARGESLAAIGAAQSSQPAPHGARILYATQGATDPPTFTLFANKELPATYLRYIERRLREAFDMGATPIKLRVRHRSN